MQMILLCDNASYVTGFVIQLYNLTLFGGDSQSV